MMKLLSQSLPASARRPLVQATALLLVSVLGFAWLVIAQEIDTDQDGMPDAFETFFGLNPTNAADADLDYDGDALSNLAEYTNWSGVFISDPFSADTDKDGWPDDLDANPVSRAYLNWGDAAFTQGDVLTYIFPSWFFGASKWGGNWDTNAQSWFVSAVDTNSACLEMELYRSSVSNDMAVQFTFLDTTNAALYVDLLDTNAAVVVTNLFGNILTGAGGTNVIVATLPLSSYVDAAIVRLRRGMGNVEVFDTLLYFDQDLDTLDDAQEAQLGTSDLLADTDGDGLSDGLEVFTYGTNPLLADTDGDGMNDGNEVAYGRDPLTADSYTAIPFVENFESNTVALGQLHDQNGWTVVPAAGAQVQTNEVFEGSAALKIESEPEAVVQHLFAAPTGNVVWCDMRLRVIPYSQPPEDVSCCGAVYVDEDCRLVVYDGGDWVTLTNHAALAYGDWMRLSVKADYALQKWEVYLNSCLIAQNLAFATPTAQFSSVEFQGCAGGVDALSVLTTTPAGVSADGNSLPDDWELLYWTNLSNPDDGDPDGDGLTNLEEWAAGTNPTLADTDGDGLSDGQEVHVYGTNPLVLDTDGDGFLDGVEIHLGLDPLSYASRPCTNWAHRLKLCLRNADQAAPLTNMPVLVVLDADRVDYAAMLPGGDDIRFLDARGTNLAYEIATWNPNGTSLLWVRLPLVSSSLLDNHFWMYWGNQQAPAGANPADVWTAGYAGVWHMEQPDGAVLDSGPGAFHGGNDGTMAAPGKLGLARDFNHIGRIAIPPAAFDQVERGITFACWLRIPSDRPINMDILLEGANSAGSEYMVACPYGNSYVYWFTCNDQDYTYKYADPSLYREEWSFWAFTKDVDTGCMDIYRNGERWHRATGRTRPFSPITMFRLGSYAQPFGYGPHVFRGLVDEFSVSHTVRSPEWIRAQYLTMSDAYLVYGGETASIVWTRDGVENGTTGRFTVSRTGVSTNLPLTVNYSLSGQAIAGQDYTELPGSITIAAGATQAVIEVTCLADATLEDPETVILTLTAGNYFIDPVAAAAALTIVDADGDTDADGLPDAWEIAWFGNLNASGTDDSDGDGVSNAAEYAHGSNPTVADTDGDGLSDYAEIYTHQTDPASADTDGDGMCDAWEIANGLNPLNAADAATDADGDGVSNLDEYRYGLNPTIAVFDSDGDNLSDADEIGIFGTDPFATDSNSNGVADVVTVVSWEGRHTVNRAGNWVTDGALLKAGSNQRARFAYEGTVNTGGMYRLGLQLTNTYASTTTTKTFRLQASVDGTPYTWMIVPVPAHTGIWTYAITPWLTPGRHNFRFAWLDDYASGKNLGVLAAVLQQIDAPDNDANGRQDWCDARLALGGDTDADGISDLDEIDIVGTDPVRPNTDAADLACVWSFGDGNGSTNRAPLHLYAAPGVATATVCVADGAGGALLATNTLTLCAPAWDQSGQTNQPPLALPAHLATIEDTGREIVLRALDYENDALTYVIVSNPVHGVVALKASGPAAVYNPAPGFTGVDTFAFIASDGATSSAPALVQIRVLPRLGGGGAAFDAVPSATNPLALAFAPVIVGPGLDGDALRDGEELTIFDTSPLAADTDADGTNDAWVVAVRNGVDTVERDNWHSLTTWHEEGTVLYNNGRFTSCTATYEVTIERPGIHRVALQMRSKEDPPDNFHFLINLSLDDNYIGTFDVRADVGAGHRGYVTTPWLEPGVYRLKLQKQNNGYAPTGRYVYPMYEKLIVYALDASAADANTNAVPDWSENLLDERSDSDGDGISDEDEILIYGTNPMNPDSDGDGLNDGLEIQLGSNPNAVDSDNDGVGDGWEWRNGTDPLSADYTPGAPPVDTISIIPAQTNAAVGAWMPTNTTSIQAIDSRGSVAYAFDVDTPFIYTLTVKGEQAFPGSAPRTLKLLAWLDGEYLGFSYIETHRAATAYFMTPWLTNGTHNLTLYWDGADQDSALRITAIDLTAYAGPDTNANGLADWIDNRLTSLYSLDAPPAALASPLCLEGRGRFFSGMSATLDGQPVTLKHGAGHRWYADVPLNPTGSVEFVLSVEHGLKSFTNTLAWQSLNLLDAANNLALRQGDALLLTAVPPAATNGVVTITVAGVTNYTTDVATPIVHTFATDGEFTLTGLHDNGIQTSNSILVTAIQAAFPADPPAVWWGKNRTFNNPAIPAEGVEIEYDTDTFISCLRPLSPAGITYNLRVDEGDTTHYLVARLADGGPICDSVAIEAAWIVGDPRHVMWHVGALPDGTQVIEGRIVVGHLPADCSIRFVMMTGGAVFANGSTSMTITAADLNALGEYRYRVYVAPGAQICHYIQLRENGVVIATDSSN